VRLRKKEGGDFRMGTGAGKLHLMSGTVIYVTERNSRRKRGGLSPLIHLSTFAEMEGRKKKRKERKSPLFLYVQR